MTDDVPQNANNFRKKTAIWRQRLQTAITRRLGLDLRALALFRVALGALVVADVWSVAWDAEAFLTDFGVLPVAPYLTEFANKLHFSLHLASGTLGWQILLLALQAIAGFGLLFGYRSKLCCIVCWILVVSLQNRNPMILNGGDVLLRLLLFWGMFLPLARRWSVDAALAQPEVERPEGAAGNLLFSGGTIALTMQVVYVYISTAILKNGEEWWPLGTASYLALSLDSFVTPFGLWMRQWFDFLRYSTYAVYFLELCGPFALFSPVFFVPVRTVTLFAFIALHLNFDLTMRLGLFPWVDIAILIALLPGELFDHLESYWRRIPRLTIYYAADCQFCQKIVYLIREAYLVKETLVLPATANSSILTTMQKEASWVVVDAKGVEHLRWDAFVTTLEHMPIFGKMWRLLPLRAAQTIGDRLYHLIAISRPQLARMTKTLLPWGEAPALAPSWFSNVMALAFTIYVGLWNLKSLPNSRIEIIPPWEKLAAYLRLDQKWNMFAPYPLKEDGWYVIDGRLSDGTQVDVLAGTVGPVSYEKPELMAYSKYKNSRWRKYLMNIWSKKKKGHRLYYGKYLCRWWNRDIDEESKELSSFEIIFMKEYSVLPDQELKVTRHSIWRHDCSKRSISSTIDLTAATSAPSTATETSSSVRTNTSTDLNIDLETPKYPQSESKEPIFDQDTFTP